MFLCPGCGEEVDLDECEETDEGCTEEFWGAPVWHPCIILSSPCCGEEIMEFEEEL